MPTGSGAGGGARDVKAGGAYVQLYSKDDISKTLDRLKARFNALGSFIGKVGNASLGAGTAILAPLSGLLAAGTSNAADVARLADQFEVPIETMSRLKYAADEAGVSIEDVAKNQAKYAGLLARAPVFNDRDARLALETERQMKEATTALQMAMLPLLQTILPLVKSFGEWARENGRVLVAAFAVGVALVTFGAAAKLAAAGIGIAAVAVGALKAAMLAVVSTPGLIVAGLAAAAAAWVLFSDEGTQAAVAVVGGFESAKESVLTAWGGIVAALQKGDLELAGKVAMAGLKALWLEGVNALTRIWVEFKRTVVSGWADIRDKLSQAALGWAAIFTHITQGKKAAMDLVMGADEQLKQMRKEEDRDREKFRNRQLEEAKKELDQAKQDLAGLAQEAAEKERQNRIDPSALNRLGIVGPIRAAFAGATLSQQLGVGDKFDQKQLALLGGILDQAKGVRGGVDQLNDNLKAK